MIMNVTVTNSPAPSHSFRPHKRLAVILAATLVAASGALVSAQESAPQAQSGGEEAPMQLRGTFDTPLGTKRPAQQGGPAHDGRMIDSAGSNIVITQSDGQDSFTLNMRGDSLVVEHNGKTVPAERIERTPDAIKVLDKSGAVIHTFNLNSIPVAPAAPSRGQKNLRILTPQGQLAAIDPPVMVGVLLDYSSEEAGIIVQRVLKGLPGDSAGLKDGDVIVEIEDKKVESNQSLRDALENKKPGNSLKVVVDREGERKELTIQLAKYDAEQLSKARGDEEQKKAAMELERFGDQNPARAFAWGDMGNEVKDTVTQSLKKALSEVKRAAGNDADKIKNDVVRALEEALTEVEANSGQWREELRALRGEGNGQGGRTMFFREMPGQVFEVPAPPAPPMPPNSPRAPQAPKERMNQNDRNKRPMSQLEQERRSERAVQSEDQSNRQAGQFDRLAQALDRLNSRLDALEKKLDDQKSSEQRQVEKK